MTAQRMVFFTGAIMISLGIWHTGFDKASWLLYIPAGFLFFAGITGICPSLRLWRKCGFK